jgi:hypothetical protein
MKTEIEKRRKQKIEKNKTPCWAEFVPWPNSRQSTAAHSRLGWKPTAYMWVPPGSRRALVKHG